jgi:hypothetical protein
MPPSFYDAVCWRYGDSLVRHEINNPVGVCLTVASTLERKSALFGAEVAGGDVKGPSLMIFSQLAAMAPLGARQC